MGGETISERIDNYPEFWAFYLGEHRKPANRLLHYCGTTLGLVLVISAIAAQIWWLLALAPVAGYGHAWVGHFIIEQNKPATFTYPGWSFLSDFKMLGYAVTGRLGHEFERLYGCRNPGPNDPCLVDFRSHV